MTEDDKNPYSRKQSNHLIEDANTKSNVIGGSEEFRLLEMLIKELIRKMKSNFGGNHE